MSRTGFVRRDAAGSSHARLLIGTSLMTLGLVLSGVQMGAAQAIELTLDNGPEDGVLDQQSGEWSGSTLIWTVTDPAGPVADDERRAWGGADEADVTGVLPVTLTPVELGINGRLAIRTLRIEGSGYRLRGSDDDALVSGVVDWPGGPRLLGFELAGSDPAGDPAPVLDLVDLRLGGEVALSGRGTVNYSGDSFGAMAVLTVGEEITLNSAGVTGGILMNHGTTALRDHQGVAENHGELTVHENLSGNLLNRAGAVAWVHGTLGRQTDNHGLLHSDGVLVGRLENRAGATANLSGEIRSSTSNRGRINLTGDLRQVGPMTNEAGGRIVLGNHLLHVHPPGEDGRGQLRNYGQVDLGQGRLLGHLLNGDGSRAGAATLDGGTIDGQFQNRHHDSTAVLTGRVTGQVVNRGSVSVSGGGAGGGELQVGGIFQNQETGRLNVDGGHAIALERGLSNAGQVVLDGGLTVGEGHQVVNGGRIELGETGSITAGRMENTGRVVSGGGIRANILNTGNGADFTSTGEITGNVTNRQSARLDSSGRIAGNLANEAGASAVLSGEVSGSIANRGRIELDGVLDAGALTNEGQGWLAIGTGDNLRLASGVLENSANSRNEGDRVGVEIAGQLDAGLDNDGRAILGSDLGATVTGDVLNRADGRVYLLGNTQVTGDFDNRGEILAGGFSNMNLQVGQDFINTGSIIGHRTLGGPITITADRIVVSDTGRIEGRVELNGTLVNGGTIRMDTDRVLSDAVENGDTGRIEVSADVDVAGHETRNSGHFEVRRNGNYRGVADFRNDGTLDVAAGGRLGADHLVNEAGGWITSDGVLDAPLLDNHAALTSTGRITGALHNHDGGSATLGGRVDGEIANHGALTTRGDLSMGQLTNHAGASAEIGGGTVRSDAPVLNDGSLTVAGQLDAAVENRATGAGITLRDGAILRGLSNAGTLSGSGRVEGAIDNLATGRVDVARGDSLTAAGGLENTGRVDLSGTLTGDVGNRDGGDLRLTSSGRLDGDVVNQGVMSGAGVVQGDILNNATGRLDLSGRVHGTLTQNGQEVLEVSGPLDLGGFVNNTGAAIGTGGDLTVRNGAQNHSQMRIGGGLTGALTNHAGADVTLEDGRIAGDLDNHGRTGGTGTVAGDAVNRQDARFSMTGEVEGTLHNHGTLADFGRLRTGALINHGGATVGPDMVLEAGDGVRNHAELTVAAEGELAGDLTNAQSAVTVVEQGGVIGGAVRNSGSLTGAGEIAGPFANLAGGEARLAGQVLGRLENDGILDSGGDLHLGGFDNRNAARIHAGHRLETAGPVRNTGLLAVTGRLEWADDATPDDRILDNDGRLALQGAVAGDILNRSALDMGPDGALAGTLHNAATGQAMLGGRIGGEVLNAGDLRIGSALDTGRIVNAEGAFARIAAERSVTTREQSLNAGTLALGGVLAGGLSNLGTGTLELNGGTIGQDLLNAGRVRGSGRVEGTFRNNGSLDITDSLTVGRFENLADLTIAPQAGLTVRDGMTNSARLALEGALRGDLDNLAGGRLVLAPGAELGGNVANAVGGVIHAPGGEIGGALDNHGLVDLADGRTGGNLTVAGLSGGGTYRLDVSLDQLASDRITVRGGAATGQMTFDFNILSYGSIGEVGLATTILDVDDSLGAANDYSYVAANLPTTSERIVYSVTRETPHSDLRIVSQVNPAIGAILGNVALTHSLIGSVINRPTSPYVVGLAYSDAEKPCGMGSWGRAVGGHAKATGATDNGQSRVESRVSADYHGMQVGTDLACFEGHFGGWNMAFGALLGVNRGSSVQPVHAISAYDATAVTNELASITRTDFDQIYGGLYVTASRDRWSFDIQYRQERTDFDISNEAVLGEGLGLSDSTLKSRGRTLSGAISYALPLGESGWFAVPTAGFAWTKFSVDDLRFEDGYRMSFGDTQSKVGFLGSTLTRTFVQPQHNTALNVFATGTWYKDFAGRTRSVFAHDTAAGFRPQTLLSDHLGSYGEASIGANYVKVLNRDAGRMRQLSAGARIDARFGDNLDSVGVTGQFRFQF